MPKRQLKLGAFMRPVSIHTGAWRYPGSWPDANFNFPHIKRLSRGIESSASWIAIPSLGVIDVFGEFFI